MKAIIIENKDCKALLDQLKSRLGDIEDKHILLGMGIPKTPKEIHRAFNYVVINWLHDQGYDMK